MKKVVFFSSDNINAQTGAAKFARLILGNKLYWKENDYLLNDYSNSDFFSDEESYRKSFTFYFKQKCKKILKKTSIGRKWSFFHYYVDYLGVKPILNAEKDLTDESAIVILNDIYVAYNYFIRYGKHKSIFIMHNSGELLSMSQEEMREPSVRDFLINAEQIILKNADMLIFVSETARRKFANKYKEYSAKTKTIYIGLPREKCKTYVRSDKLRLVTVGSVCRRKNQLLGIQAIEKIQSDNVILTVVGGGPQLDEYKNYVYSHHLDNIIHFTGALNDVQPILYENDVFVLTSKDEGLPVAAQEAMSIGLPLILTDVGGCNELICENGFLVNPELDEVIYAIKEFLEDKELIKEYGEKSYELFNTSFSLKKMHYEYVNLLNYMCHQ